MLTLGWASVHNLSGILQGVFLYVMTQVFQESNSSSCMFLLLPGLKSLMMSFLLVISQKSQKASTIQGVGKCTPPLH